MKINWCIWLPKVCQAIKMHCHVSRYCFGVKILGAMYVMFFFFCSIYVVGTKNSVR